MNYCMEHIGLPARDPVALKDWYVRVLGAKVIYDNGETPPAFFLQLSGEFMIEIYAGRFSIVETSENDLAGWRHLALRVESIEQARAELAMQGVIFREEPKPAGGGGRVAFFRDGEGNLLHLVERPEGSVLR
jgi:glyoxylase I family protein